MPTYRLDIAYDGSGFRGFARNRGVRTVQKVLEESIGIVVRSPVEVTVAGRTDAGVHANHNVVSCTLGAPIDPRRLVRSVNRMLGGEVVVIDAAIVDDDFNARFSARSRAYRYVLDCSAGPDPLTRLQAWHVGPGLDAAAMENAASALVGEHDFASFCRKAGGRTTVRKVISAGWRRTDDHLVFEVEASSFCHQMVRSMVALCVAVGKGQVSAADVPGIIAARDRNASRGTAPPHGLHLWGVRY